MWILANCILKYTWFCLTLTVIIMVDKSLEKCLTKQCGREVKKIFWFIAVIAFVFFVFFKKIEYLGRLKIWFKVRRFSADLSRANSRTGLPIRRCSYVPQLGPITCQVFNTDGNKKSCNEKQVGQKSVDFASFRERKSNVS